MTHLELQARISPDGMLTPSVPVGISEANRDIAVIVEPADAQSCDGPLKARLWFARGTPPPDPPPRGREGITA
jgi:hypothetical protein